MGGQRQSPVSNHSPEAIEEGRRLKRECDSKLELLADTFNLNRREVDDFLHDRWHELDPSPTTWGKLVDDYVATREAYLAFCRQNGWSPPVPIMEWGFDDHAQPLANSRYWKRSTDRELVTAVAKMQSLVGELFPSIELKLADGSSQLLTIDGFASSIVEYPVESLQRTIASCRIFSGLVEVIIERRSDQRDTVTYRLSEKVRRHLLERIRRVVDQECFKEECTPEHHATCLFAEYMALHQSLEKYRDGTVSKVGPEEFYNHREQLSVIDEHLATFKARPEAMKELPESVQRHLKVVWKTYYEARKPKISFAEQLLSLVAVDLFTSAKAGYEAFIEYKHSLKSDPIAPTFDDEDVLANIRKQPVDKASQVISPTENSITNTSIGMMLHDCVKWELDEELERKFQLALREYSANGGKKWPKFDQDVIFAKWHIGGGTDALIRNEWNRLNPTKKLSDGHDERGRGMVKDRLDVVFKKILPLAELKKFRKSP